MAIKLLHHIADLLFRLSITFEDWAGRCRIKAKRMTLDQRIRAMRRGRA